jgi:drug/metabolite transporter (DMT)-like permease
VAGALFSTGGAAVKLCQLSPWQIAGLRSLVAGVAIFVLLPRARRGWSWRIVPVAMAYAGTVVTFVFANKLTTAGSAIFLQATAPLHLAYLAPLLLGERPGRRGLWLTLWLFAGMACFFVATDPVSATAPDPIRGNLVGAASGLFYAFTLLGLRWLERSGGGASSGAAAVVCGNLLAFVVTLPAAWPYSGGTTVDWLTVLYLGLFQLGLGYVLVTRALGSIDALSASLLLLIEPALNPLWAWLLHGEMPGKWAWVGGAIVLSGTVLRARWEARARPGPSR